MPFPKKKPKKTSQQLEYLRKMREQEWEDVMGKTGRTKVDRTKEMAKLIKKYGTKP